MLSLLLGLCTTIRLFEP
jgi:hypothetical protein